MPVLRTLLALRLKGRNRLGTLGLLIVMVLATAGVVSALEVRSGTADRLDVLYVETGRPDLVINGGPDGVPAAIEAAFAEGTIDAASAFDTAFVSFPTPEGPEVGTTLVSLDAIQAGEGSVGGTAVGEIILRSGRLPSAAGEIVIDAGAAIAHDYDLGDVVTVGFRETAHELTVVGTAVDLSRCFYPACSPLRGYVSADGLDAIAGGATYTRAHLSLAGDDVTTADRQRVADALMASGLIDGVDTWDGTRADLLLTGRIFVGFLAGFGIFVLIATLLMVASTAFGAVDTRRREMGMLKAIGATPRQLIAVVVLEHVIVGLVGAALGWVLGSLIAPRLHLGLVDVLGRAEPTFDPASLAIVVAMVVLVLTAATISPARRAGAESTRSMIGDAPSASPRLRGLLARLPLSPSGQLGAQLALARPIRAALATVALAAAVAAGVTGWRLSAAVESLVDEPALAGDNYDVLVGVPTERESVAETLATVDGIGRWYTEAGAVGTLDGSDVGVRAVGDEVADAGLVVVDGRMPAGPGEALVGWGLLRDGRAAIGDTVTVELESGDIEATIVGRHGDLDHEGDVIVVSMSDYLAADPAGRLHWRVAGDGSIDRAEMAERIELAFDGRALVQLATDATSQLRPFRIVLAILVGMVTAVAAANLGTTLVATVRERRRELGVVRSLGFTSAELRSQSATGGAVLGGLGVVLGIPIGLVASGRIIDAAADEVGLGPGVLQSGTATPAVVAMVVGIVIAGGIGAASSRNLRRAHLPDLVREV